MYKNNEVEKVIYYGLKNRQIQYDFFSFGKSNRNDSRSKIKNSINEIYSKEIEIDFENKIENTSSDSKAPFPSL